RSSAAVGVWVEVGSRAEAPEEAGLTHFVEHMVFKGTERRSALDLARELDAVGGRMNAFTGKEQTCFHARVLDEHFERAADLLTDMLLHPAFDKDELERERAVILQEIGMVEDQPEDYVHEVFQQTFWPAHPLGRPILGTAESVSRHSREDLVRFMRLRYAPARVLVSVAGNVTHERVLREIAPKLEALRAPDFPENVSPPAVAPARKVVERDAEQAHVVLGVPGLARKHPDRFAWHVLDTVLGGSMSSRLFQEVREKRGLAYSVYSFAEAYLDGGAFGVYMGVAPETLAQAVEVTAAELRRARSEPVDARTLREAKDHFKGALMLALEGADAWMNKIARDEVEHGRMVEPEELIAAVEAVTAEDVRRLAEALLREDALVACALGPISESDLPAIPLA
ncbi:MAG: insulinase family protein, partial [Candidatus Methylomirabilis sp.]|nr:insulinase family protein [Deltaproteobacteria bacterium]